MAGAANGTGNGADGDVRARLQKLQAAFLETLDFPQEYLTPAYRHGVTLYEHGRYDEAAQVFRFLAACDCSNPRIWKALGAAHKMSGRFDEAVAAFGIAVNTGSLDPWVPVHAAECLMHLERSPEAIAAMKQAALVADVSEDGLEVHRRLGALIEGVERSLAA